MKKIKLRQYIEFLSGNADAETFEHIRQELEDPESASSRFFRGMGQATEDPFGWGRPLFGPGDVLEEEDETTEDETTEDEIAPPPGVDTPPFPPTDVTATGDVGGLIHPANPTIGPSDFPFDANLASLVPATFGDASGESSPAADQLVRWKTTMPLHRAEWLNRDDEAEVGRIENKDVAVEFSWRAPVLEIRLTGAVALGHPDVRCSAVLLGPSGEVRHRAESIERTLRFSLPNSEELASLVFECDYWRDGRYGVRLRVPVRPQVAE